jgi:hypothetical protein
LRPTQIRYTLRVLATPKIFYNFQESSTMTDSHAQADAKAMRQAALHQQKKHRAATKAKKMVERATPKPRVVDPYEDLGSRKPGKRATPGENLRSTQKAIARSENAAAEQKRRVRVSREKAAKPKSRPARPKQVTKAPPKPKAPRASFTDPDKKISYSKQNVRTATQNKKAGDKLASKLKGNKSAAMKSIAKNRVAKSGAKSLAKGALKSVARRSAPFAAVAAGKSLYDATQTPAAKKRVADRKKNTAKMTRKGMDIATGKAARKKAAKATTKPIRIKHPGQAARKKAAKPKK